MNNEQYIPKVGDTIYQVTEDGTGIQFYEIININYIQRLCPYGISDEGTILTLQPYGDGTEFKIKEMPWAEIQDIHNRFCTSLKAAEAHQYNVKINYIHYKINSIKADIKQYKKDIKNFKRELKLIKR